MLENQEQFSGDRYITEKVFNQKMPSWIQMKGIYDKDWTSGYTREQKAHIRLRLIVFIDGVNVDKDSMYSEMYRAILKKREYSPIANLVTWTQQSIRFSYWI